MKQKKFNKMKNKLVKTMNVWQGKKETIKTISKLCPNHLEYHISMDFDKNALVIERRRKK